MRNGTMLVNGDAAELLRKRSTELGTLLAREAGKRLARASATSASSRPPNSWAVSTTGVCRRGLNLVHGPAAEMTDAYLGHAAVRVVSFTGVDRGG